MVSVATPSPIIGWVGLGDQGMPLVRRLLSSDATVKVWARRPAAIAPLRDTSVQVARTLHELSGEADFIGICVTSDHDVVEVVLESGLIDGMKPGAVLAIHSTVQTATCARVGIGCPRSWCSGD